MDEFILLVLQWMILYYLCYLMDQSILLAHKWMNLYYSCCFLFKTVVIQVCLVVLPVDRKRTFYKLKDFQIRYSHLLRHHRYFIFNDFIVLLQPTLILALSDDNEFFFTFQITKRICEEQLLTVRGLVSFTFDMTKYRCIVRARPDTTAEIICQSINKTKVLSAQQIVKNERGEEVSITARLGNNVSWFVHLQETWPGNNVSWFVHLSSGNMARKQCFLVCLPSGNMAGKQCFLVCAPSGNMAGKQCFLVCPPPGNMARKQCFLVCAPSGNMARKQCFLVCAPSGNMARKQCFLVCAPSGNMARKQCFLVCAPSGNMARKQCFLVCAPSGNMARKQGFMHGLSTLKETCLVNTFWKQIVLIPSFLMFWEQIWKQRNKLYLSV